MFAAANLLLFVGWCVFASLTSPGSTVGSVAEFWIYAGSILAIVGLCWLFLRLQPCGAWLLVLIEVGLLAHFAGAFVPVDGGRLYEARILGMRFDQLVHLLNAFAGAALLDHFLQGRLRGRGLVLIGLVLGAGSVVEIIEYLAFLVVPDAGVGGYANNMQDLLMNLAGALLYLAARAAGMRLDARRHGSVL